MDEEENMLSVGDRVVSLLKPVPVGTVVWVDNEMKVAYVEWYEGSSIREVFHYLERVDGHDHD